MNKAELIDRVAQKSGETKTAVGKALDATLAAISDAVASGDTVTLVGFGTFKATKRAARAGKNPRTGEALTIAAATVPKFTAGSTFKEMVNQGKKKKK